MYPCDEFISRMWTIYQFSVKLLPLLDDTTKILGDVVSYLTPHVMKCPIFRLVGNKEIYKC